MKTPQLEWQVIPDYAWQGRHPLHDARFIATSNDVEITEYGEDSNPPRSWRFANPQDSIICTMADCEHQKEYARLIAAAPELLDACKAAHRALQCSIGNEKLSDHFPIKVAMLEAAIQKAQGD